ncbi:MAG TPA: hypothetical protein PLT50_00510 [bacterium]|nr:hypothetical protein [bacterium]
MIIKTDWKGSDAITADAMNRIERNIETNSTIADWPTATGTTTIEVDAPHFELKAGKSLTFIAGGNNNSNPTTININGLGAKNLYKANTSEAPLIKTGRAYSVWYSGTDFFVKASAEGNAVAGDVVKNKTFSSDADTGITGTLELTGSAAVGDVLATKTFYNTNPQSQVTGTMTNNGTVSTDISAKETEVTIAQGYHSGSGKVKIATAEQDKIITGNIKAGVTILGVAGKTEVVDTSSGDAVAGDILNGKKAWVNGVEVTGTASPPTVQTAYVTGPTAGAGTITFTGITLSTKMTVVIWADNDPYQSSILTTFVLIKRDAGTISHGYVTYGGYEGCSGSGVITVNFSGTSIEVTGPNWDHYSTYRLIAFNQE